MFTIKGLLIVGVLAFALCLGAILLDGYNLDVTDTWSIPLHLEYLQIITFVAGVFCFVMVGMGSIVNSGVGIGILGRDGEEEQSYDFSDEELIALDQEDEPHWNQTQRDLAIANPNWQGLTTYRDYRGWLRDAWTDEYVGDRDPDADRRHVIRGKRVR